MICPGCLQENAPGSRRCGQCGLPLPTRGASPPAQAADPESVHFLGGEPTPQYQMTATVRADPASGYLGEPRLDAAERARRSQLASPPPSRSALLLRSVALGVRSGVAVAAFLGFLGTLLAIGANQMNPQLGHPLLAIFLLCFLRYLAAGVVAGALIGWVTGITGNLAFSWVVGVPLGIIYWVAVYVPTAGTTSEELSALAVAQGLVWFGLAGGGFGHLVGRLLATSINRWD